MSLDSQNPYSSPATSSKNTFDINQSLSGEVIPASQGKRFINFIIDQFALSGLSSVLGFFVGIAFAVATADSNGNVSQSGLATLQIVATLLGWVATWVYYSVLEATFGITLGKLVTGTKVVAANGSVPSTGQIMGRSLCRFIPFEVFSFFGGKGRPVGWHDSISGTRVIETR